MLGRQGLSFIELGGQRIESRVRTDLWNLSPSNQSLWTSASQNPRMQAKAPPFPTCIQGPSSGAWPRPPASGFSLQPGPSP